MYDPSYFIVSNGLRFLATVLITIDPQSRRYAVLTAGDARFRVLCR